jgi:hypothetical protein
MVKEKGMTEFNYSVGFGSLAGTMDFNAYHSVSKHAGILFNFNRFQGYDDGSGSASVEVGSGYFTSLSENWGFDAYATLGYGAGKNDCIRLGIQPGIFYSRKKLEVGFGCRMMMLQYGKNPNPYYAPTFEQASATNTDHFLVEPTLKLAVGNEKIKFTIQSTFAAKLNSGYLEYDPFVLALGVSLKLPGK